MEIVKQMHVLMETAWYPPMPKEVAEVALRRLEADAERIDDCISFHLFSHIKNPADRKKSRLAFEFIALLPPRKRIPPSKRQAFRSNVRTILACLRHRPVCAQGKSKSEQGAYVIKYRRATSAPWLKLLNAPSGPTIAEINSAIWSANNFLHAAFPGWRAKRSIVLVRQSIDINHAADAVRFALEAAQEIIDFWSKAFDDVSRKNDRIQNEFRVAKRKNKNA